MTKKLQLYDAFMIFNPEWLIYNYSNIIQLIKYIYKTLILSNRILTNVKFYVVGINTVLFLLFFVS